MCIGLSARRGSPDEDRLLFYQAVTTPGERLILCYPKTGSDGAVTLRSFYLDEVEQALRPEPLPVKALTLSDRRAFVPLGRVD